jgi:co-chaperonin GroES (HSP10)
MTIADKIKPLRNNVRFQFLDATHGTKGAFTPRRTASGIVLLATESEQRRNRWGKVVAAGPDASVEVGEFILIEALMWMEGVSIDDEKIWKTDDTKIIVATTDESMCENQ